MAGFIDSEGKNVTADMFYPHYLDRSEREISLIDSMVKDAESGRSTATEDLCLRHGISTMSVTIARFDARIEFIRRQCRRRGYLVSLRLVNDD